MVSEDRSRASIPLARCTESPRRVTLVPDGDRVQVGAHPTAPVPFAAGPRTGAAHRSPPAECAGTGDGLYTPGLTELMLNPGTRRAGIAARGK
ncbi:hypothetical protein GCM10009716_28730 [Streptomyces sodiiphilus]|uniref:Uncharacterized protein n=1 Tax=Streptomyces sodiiphilus TaxID=226217 RepID=A0ABN2PCN9_9ACTN